MSCHPAAPGRNLAALAIWLLVASLVSTAAHAQSREAQAWMEKGVAALDRGDRVAMNEAYAKACEVDPRSIGCTSAGYNFRRGYGVPQDLPRAMLLLERSCSAGVEKGCAELAKLREACKTDSLESCVIARGDPAPKPAARVATPARAATPAPAPTTPAQRCDAGDAYACEKHAWDMGKAGSWAMGAQYARKGCQLGRSSSCSARSVYETNLGKFGDQSGAGPEARRQAVVARAQTRGFGAEIRGQLAGERDLATVAQLIALGGEDALKNLTFDEMADLAGQNWEPNYGLAGMYVQSEWQRRDGPANLAARKRAQANNDRQQEKTFQGVGDNETGTAACYVNGGPGKRYQYSGADGKMVYGPCIAI